MSAALRLLTLALLAVTAAAQNVVLSVRADGTGNFTSVQRALDSLTPGSNPSLGHVTLQIEGRFWERVHIYSNFTNGVSIIGVGALPDDL